MADDGENLTKQIDEIGALSAIYPDEWNTEDEAFRTYSATVKEGGRSAQLLVTLPPEYPSNSPPFYLLTAPWMKDQDKDELYNLLESLYMENIGESCIHIWIEKLRDYLRTKYPSEATSDLCSANNVITEEPPKKIPVFDLTVVNEVCPEITSADPFCDRKSTFQGHVATVTNAEQVKIVLARLYENRKIAQATHNMYAYRIQNEKMILQDCEDDGETHAGGRLLHLLQILDVKNVVVVVSRWFGGILLGGDRFKLINNAAREALELGSYVTKSGSQNADNKKKSKKK